MTRPTNDDFAIRELPIEELEAIAAGGLWGWIKHEASAAVHWIESPNFVSRTAFVSIVTAAAVVRAVFG
jgi:hypothetical protein